MNKFEESFLQLLVKQWNFYIKDYYSATEKSNKWIAVLDNTEFLYCVIVSSDEKSDFNYIEAVEAMRNQSEKPVMVNVIIPITGSQNLYSNNTYSKLIYSLDEKRVVYSHDGCKPLLPLLDYMDKVNKRSRKSFRDNLITNILISVNIVIFILTAFMSNSIYNIDSRVLIGMGAKVNVLINHGQIWRLITCTFLHGGLAHIAFNMFALNIVGKDIEYAFGKVKYIIIYFAAGLGGSIFSYIFSPNSISVGASGAIFGLLGAMLAYGYINRSKIGKSYMKNIFKVIVINIVIGITISNIDNWAHIGGLVFGAIVAAGCEGYMKISSKKEA